MHIAEYCFSFKFLPVEEGQTRDAHMREFGRYNTLKTFISHFSEKMAKISLKSSKSDEV